MQGNEKMIEALNAGLTIELTAINQYFCQSRMCKNWGYDKLAEHHYRESIEEMKHAELLIDRVLFLDGVPEIARYDVIRVGDDAKAQLENDLQLELNAVAKYNEAAQLAIDLNDAGSREIVEKIIVESEESVDWLEAQLHLIETVGIENYLAQQMGEGEDG